MFDSSIVNTEEKKFGSSKYISYGIQQLKFNKLEIKVASTGSKQIIFYAEGPAIKEEGFEGIDGAKGAVGRIKTMYMKPEQESNLIMMFAKIADGMGVRAELDAIKSSSLEDYIAKVEKVITGKFANFVVSGEGYINNTSGKVNYNLGFPKYDFVEAIGVEKSRLKFDKANSYHFKDAVIPTNIGTPESKTAVKADEDTLPF